MFQLFEDRNLRVDIAESRDRGKDRGRGRGGQGNVLKDKTTCKYII